MAAKEQAIRDALRNDATFAALVVGGTWLYDDLGARGLSPDSAEANGCYDSNGLLKLTAVITFEAGTEAEVVRSERQWLTLWLYHPTSLTLIKQARRAAQDALHHFQISTSGSGEGKPILQWVNHLPDFKSDELNGALGGGSRYIVLFSRI